MSKLLDRNSDLSHEKVIPESTAIGIVSLRTLDHAIMWCSFTRTRTF